MNTANYHNLYSFTAMWVSSARRAAKAGRKDQARDVLRFVRNASIIDILKPIEFGDVFKADIPHLQWQISELESECHPMSQADFLDDFEAIRHQVDMLAGGMAMILSELRSKPKV